jgi:hypothetical protein
VRPVEQRQRRVAWMLGGDHNPLRRPVDKIEAAIMTGLFVAFLVAAPLLCIFAGRVVDASFLQEQRAERNWHQVPATLLQSASAGQVDLEAWDISWVKAQWKGPGDKKETGFVATDLNAKAGQQVWVTITQSGQLTHSKLTRADLRDEIADASLMITVALAAVLGLAALAVRAIAERRRMAGWTRAWDGVGPRWSQLL